MSGGPFWADTSQNGIDSLIAVSASEGDLKKRRQVAKDHPITQFAETASSGRRRVGARDLLYIATHHGYLWLAIVEAGRGFFDGRQRP